MLSLVQLFAFRHSICRPPKAEAWSGAMRGAHNYCRSLAKDRTQGCLIFSQHLWSLILGFYGGIYPIVLSPLTYSTARECTDH